MIYVLIFLHFINTDNLHYYQIGTYSDKQECLEQAEKAKILVTHKLNESSLPRSKRPIIIERGKKFAAYDKRGKIHHIRDIIGKIVQEYADAQNKNTI